MIRGFRLVSSFALCASLVLGQETDASRAKQRIILNDPGVIQIRLALIGKGSTPTQGSSEVIEPFKEGDKLKIRVIITNNSHEMVRVPISDTYVQNRPQLYRDGDLVPYKQNIEKLVKTNANEPDFLRTDSSLLSPGSPKPIEIIDLADWYKPLRVGHYQLAVKHRFEQGGTWIESSPVTFEIDPK